MDDNELIVLNFTHRILNNAALFAAWTDDEHAALMRFVRLALTQMEAWGDAQRAAEEDR